MMIWLLVTICDLLIPLLMIGFGSAFQKHPPKEINGLYGYRTSRSMKNQETWLFANQYCGKLWWKLGWILFWLTLAAHLPFMKCQGNEASLTVLCLLVTLLQCVVLIGSVFPVENELKKQFNEQGVRR